MFDFLKPEVSGLKNVLISYDTYALNIWGRKGGGIPHSMMGDFATWYFSHRFGPPLILNPIRSQNMIALAQAKAQQTAQEYFSGQMTVYSVLVGMMTAENLKTDFLDYAALKRLLARGNRQLPKELLGF